MTALTLVKAGYGTLKEIEAMDSTEFLDIVEYENIQADIQAHLIDNPED